MACAAFNILGSRLIVIGRLWFVAGLLSVRDRHLLGR
jgi:hypothetical protein